MTDWRIGFRIQMKKKGVNAESNRNLTKIYRSVSKDIDIWSAARDNENRAGGYCSKIGNEISDDIEFQATDQSWLSTTPQTN
jgi:hypothetical protein